MSQGQEIHIRIEGRAGRITLARPDALNALTHDMALAMERSLIGWQDDDAVELIILDAEGEKAFCAGGDLEKLYESGKAGDLSHARGFWTDEYRLNALLAEYRKPVVALMQGYVMGGGVGIGCHASHRVVCESTQIAMPECGIGLVPDVGGSFLLAGAPGHLGEYLGLTGARMNAADAIHTGFADIYVHRDDWRSLLSVLCNTGEAERVVGYASSAGDSELKTNEADIDAVFAGTDALDCLGILETRTDEWAQTSAKSIRRGCPLSVACAFELIRMNRQVNDVRIALANELRFTWRSMSHGEFLEGVRALIIDKDRDPKWRTERLEDVSQQQIAAMLAPIANEASERSANPGRRAG